MRQGKGWLMVWVAVILGLGLWAPGALAFWPPCQQVDAWKDETDPNHTVHYKVYDPKKDAYVEESWSNPQVQIYGLDFPHGLVYWTASVSSHGALYCRVYDPGRSSWRGDDWIAIDYFGGVPEAEDGVIAWLANGGPGVTKCVLRTYDPGPGAWQGGELISNYPDISYEYLITHSGVVAWALRTFATPSQVYTTHILFAVYDPSLAAWRTGEAHIDLNANDPWPSLLIDQGTVVFGDYRFGYNAASGEWVTGFDTLPLSRFVAQPTVGKAPLWVWFTDMSIGGPTWVRSWTFGDGGSSLMVRSPSHTYTSTGKFTVTQVVAPETDNASSSSREIRVTGAGPRSTPALDLLLLQ
jgi:hypothetical protein